MKDGEPEIESQSTSVTEENSAVKRVGDSPNNSTPLRGGQIGIKQMMAVTAVISVVCAVKRMLAVLNRKTRVVLISKYHAKLNRIAREEPSGIGRGSKQLNVQSNKRPNGIRLARRNNEALPSAHSRTRKTNRDRVTPETVPNRKRNRSEPSTV